MHLSFLAPTACIQQNAAKKDLNHTKAHLYELELLACTEIVVVRSCCQLLNAVNGKWFISSTLCADVAVTQTAIIKLS